MKQGQRLRLTIEKPAAGGRMIARHDGAVVLVSGAIPGETVEADVEKVQRGTGWARTVAVLEPSPDRVAPAVDVACGGNVFAFVAYPRQLVLKREIVRDGFTRIGRLSLPDDVPVHGSIVDGYRMRARLHVRHGRIGFFREGTHDLCPLAGAGQLLPEAVAAIGRLEAALAAVPQAEVAEIELAEDVEGRTRVCHLELAAEGNPAGLAALPPIEGLTGLSWSPAGAEGSLALQGDPTVHDTIDCAVGERHARVRLRRHARAFFQANRFLVTPLVNAVAARAGTGPVIDLYAGVGLFAAALVGLGWTSVTAVEGDPWSARDLEANAVTAGPALGVAHQSVEAFVDGCGRVSPETTVIVDPPRTGLSRDALAGILGLGAGRLVYVSCDVATLARDARAIVEAGYVLGPVELFDLFPNTAHIETVVTFTRDEPPR
ncbi:MAG: TRAM domain-containing protein [Vicinamibacterales bacterium]|nr:TRAM domain-containing protein [Vicinamibacterales bacterium]